MTLAQEFSGNGIREEQLIMATEDGAAPGKEQSPPSPVTVPDFAECGDMKPVQVEQQHQHSPVPVPQSALELSAEQRKRMVKLTASMGNHQGNKGKKQWDKAAACFVCERAKHSCKWAVREKNELTGSWCYSCVFSALKLKATKNQSVLEACPDIRSLLKKRSLQKIADLTLRGEDICQCAACRRSRVPTKRLRSKTSL